MECYLEKIKFTVQLYICVKSFVNLALGVFNNRSTTNRGLNEFFTTISYYTAQEEYDPVNQTSIKPKTLLHTGNFDYLV